VPFRPQLPAVYEIADDIEIAAIALAQEFQEGVNPRVLRAEMDVGNPNRAKPHFVRRERFRVCDHKLVLTYSTIVLSPKGFNLKQPMS
jgi:hypothetical protein